MRKNRLEERSAAAMLNLNFPCLFHLATGYYCPGCGGTRAIASLLHGQLFRSFLYHPVILYTAFLLLRGLVFSILEFAKSGRFSWTWSGKLKKYDIFWLLFLTMAHFLILNALKAFFDLDLLEQI